MYSAEAMTQLDACFTSINLCIKSQTEATRPTAVYSLCRAMTDAGNLCNAASHGGHT